MKKTISEIFRFIVGLIFICSGFFKILDPLGSAYKIEEYVSASVLDLEFLTPHSIFLAVFLIVVEFILGVALLIGYKTKLTSMALSFMTALFLFLTWYAAFFDKVKDCGCFGEIIKLSPWMTFYKNVLLFCLINWVMFEHKQIKILPKRRTMNWILSLSFSLSVYLIYHSLTDLPFFDFSPYALGKNIEKGMKMNGNAPAAVQNFFLLSGTNDMTQCILKSEKVMLIVSNDSVMDFKKRREFNDLISISKKAKEKGYLVYGLSSARDFSLQEAPPFEVFLCDKSTLRSMIRSKLGILILNKATIKHKISHKNLKKLNLML